MSILDFLQTNLDITVACWYVSFTTASKSSGPFRQNTRLHCSRRAGPSSSIAVLSLSYYIRKRKRSWNENLPVHRGIRQTWVEVLFEMHHLLDWSFPGFNTDQWNSPIAANVNPSTTLDRLEGKLSQYWIEFKYLVRGGGDTGEGREPTGSGTSNSTQLPKLAPSHPVDWVWSTHML